MRMSRRGGRADEDLERTLELLQYQVSLLGHLVCKLTAHLDVDFEQLLEDAEREMSKPDLRLVKG
jgi:hypothetical protein